MFDFSRHAFKARSFALSAVSAQTTGAVSSLFGAKAAHLSCANSSVGNSKAATINAKLRRWWLIPVSLELDHDTAIMQYLKFFVEAHGLGVYTTS